MSSGSYADRLYSQCFRPISPPPHLSSNKPTLTFVSPKSPPLYYLSFDCATLPSQCTSRNPSKTLFTTSNAGSPINESESPVSLATLKALTIPRQTRLLRPTPTFTRKGTLCHLPRFPRRLALQSEADSPHSSAFASHPTPQSSTITTYFTKSGDQIESVRVTVPS